MLVLAELGNIESVGAALINLPSGFPTGLDCKESAYNAGEPGFISWVGDPLEKGMAIQ